MKRLSPTSAPTRRLFSWKKAEFGVTIVPLWERLTPEQQTLLRQHTDMRRYAKGQAIYREGNEPQDFLCLLRGRAKVYRAGNGQRMQTMRILVPVQFFGYRAYFARERYVTSALAIEPSLVAHIPMDIVERIALENKEIAHYFIHQLAKDLGISDRRSTTLMQSHLRGRLAETILFLVHQYGLRRDGVTLAIDLTREDLAALSNMTTANAIRTLSAFAAEGLIQLDERLIRLVNLPKLQQIAHTG